MFKTFVRPKLEYASEVWNPSSGVNINAIENVQSRFTKKVRGLWDIPYSERFTILHLPSLESRRLFKDLCFLFKIYHGHVNIPFDLLFTRANSTTRGLTLKIRQAPARTDARHDSFGVWTIAAWNTLDQSVVSCNIISTFKTLVANSNLHDFIKGGY